MGGSVDGRGRADDEDGINGVDIADIAITTTTTIALNFIKIEVMILVCTLILCYMVWVIYNRYVAFAWTLVSPILLSSFQFIYQLG